MSDKAADIEVACSSKNTHHATPERRHSCSLIRQSNSSAQFPRYNSLNKAEAQRNWGGYFTAKHHFASNVSAEEESSQELLSCAFHCCRICDSRQPKWAFPPVHPAQEFIRNDDLYILSPDALEELITPERVWTKRRFFFIVILWIATFCALVNQVLNNFCRPIIPLGIGCAAFLCVAVCDIGTWLEIRRRRRLAANFRLTPNCRLPAAEDLFPPLNPPFYTSREIAYRSTGVPLSQRWKSSFTRSASSACSVIYTPSESRYPNCLSLPGVCQPLLHDDSICRKHAVFSGQQDQRGLELQAQRPLKRRSFQSTRDDSYDQFRIEQGRVERLRAEQMTSKDGWGRFLSGIIAAWRKSPSDHIYNGFEAITGIEQTPQYAEDNTPGVLDTTVSRYGLNSSAVKESVLGDPVRISSLPKYSEMFFHSTEDECDVNESGYRMSLSQQLCASCDGEAHSVGNVLNTADTDAAADVDDSKGFPGKSPTPCPPRGFYLGENGTKPNGARNPTETLPALLSTPIKEKKPSYILGRRIQCGEFEEVPPDSFFDLLRDKRLSVKLELMAPFATTTAMNARKKTTMTPKGSPDHILSESQAQNLGIVLAKLSASPQELKQSLFISMCFPAFVLCASDGPPYLTREPETVVAGSVTGGFIMENTLLQLETCGKSIPLPHHRRQNNTTCSWCVLVQETKDLTGCATVVDLPGRCLARVGEDLDRLIKVLPKPEEFETISSFDTSPVHDLRDVERELLPLCPLTFPLERLFAWTYVLAFEAQKAQVINNFATILRALKEVRESSTLQWAYAAILAVVNVANRPSEQFRAQDADVESYPAVDPSETCLTGVGSPQASEIRGIPLKDAFKLANVRSEAVRPFSLLHFVVLLLTDSLLRGNTHDFCSDHEKAASDFGKATTNQWLNARTGKHLLGTFKDGCSNSGLQLPRVEKFPRSKWEQQRSSTLLRRRDLGSVRPQRESYVRRKTHSFNSSAPYNKSGSRSRSHISPVPRTRIIEVNGNSGLPKSGLLRNSRTRTTPAYPCMQSETSNPSPLRRKGLYDVSLLASNHTSCAGAALAPTPATSKVPTRIVPTEKVTLDCTSSLVDLCESNKTEQLQNAVSKTSCREKFKLTPLALNATAVAQVKRLFPSLSERLRQDIPTLPMAIRIPVTGCRKLLTELISGYSRIKCFAASLEDTGRSCAHPYLITFPETVVLIGKNIEALQCSWNEVNEAAESFTQFFCDATDGKSLNRTEAAMELLTTIKELVDTIEKTWDEIIGNCRLIHQAFPHGFWLCEELVAAAASRCSGGTRGVFHLPPKKGLASTRRWPK